MKGDFNAFGAQPDTAPAALLTRPGFSAANLADHNLAKGVGAGGGAAAGAALGAAGGPVGMAAGAAIGAAAGSAAGKGTGEVVNPKPGDKSRA